MEGSKYQEGKSSHQEALDDRMQTEGMHTG